MICEAIVLAGGLGTRLRSAVPDVPKSMAAVAGRPFLSWIIDYYLNGGIKHFIFSLGYKHEIIVQFLKDHYPSLSYSSAIENEPLGTGGAILNACRLATEKTTLVLNGDTLFKVNVSEMDAFHSTMQSTCTLALKEMRQSERYGVVDMEADGRISAFREKQYYEKSVINGGVYALDVKRFMDEDLPSKFSFEKDYLEKYCRERRFFGLMQHGYFIDIGIPEDFTKANTDFNDNQSFADRQ